MISPSNPEQEGSNEVYQDGRPNSTNEAQFAKANNGGTIKETDAHENTHKQK